MADKNEYSMKEALDKWLESKRMSQKFNEAKLIESWEALMGPTISRYTEKIYIRDKVLHVKLTSPALRHELHMSKRKIIDLFNQKIAENIILDVRLS